MKKSISILLAMLMMVTVFAGLNITAFADTPENGWYKNDDGYWYYYVDGDYTTGWKKIDSKWYFFYDDGEMACNTHEHMEDAQGNEVVYVFGKSGAMLSNGWGKITYSNTYSDGYTETWTEWYYLNKNGTAVTEQWKKINGKWYYFDDCGEMYCNDVYSITDKNDVTKYWAFDKSGALVEKAGWFKFTWTWYDSSEKKEVTSSDWVYTNKNGTVLTDQWKKSNNEWYYLGDWGYMYSDGLYRIGGEESIYKDVIAVSDEDYDSTGMKGDYGKLYAFDKSGKMLKNQWYQGYEGGGIKSVAVSDVMYAKVSSDEGYWYYLGTDGAAVTGWKQIKNVWYYFVPNYGSAVMVTGPQAISKTKGVYTSSEDTDVTPYFFLDSGAMASERWCKWSPSYILRDVKGVDSSSTIWFYATKSGVLAQGWKQIKGSWYYFYTVEDNELLAVMATGWLEKEDGTYYLDPTSGKMVTGTVKIDDYDYTFDKSGRLIQEVE